MNPDTGGAYNKRVKKTLCLILSSVVIIIMISVIGIYGAGHVSESETGVIRPPDISNRDEVVKAVRGGLKRHAKTIYVEFSSHKSDQSQIDSYVSDIMEDALCETDACDEGDYIRYQYGGYKLITDTNQTDTNDIQYKLQIVPDYYTYRVWEDEVDVWIDKIVSGFGLSSKDDDITKIKRVYEYIKKNIAYDEVHKKNANHHLKTTAYAAMKYKSVVCQGYAVLAYRLFREVGIRCRIVTGEAISVSGERERHAWNIVELDGIYYNLDITWDKLTKTGKYFLKSADDFSDHIPDDEFRTDSFVNTYKIAKRSYSKKNT